MGPADVLDEVLYLKPPLGAKEGSVVAVLFILPLASESYQFLCEDLIAGVYCGKNKLWQHRSSHLRTHALPDYHHVERKAI
jgi:hypothetical protein